MQSTIIELFKFQELYLESLISNIPEERLYEKQLKGFNSAGWILGHLCIEAEDIFNHLDIPFEKMNNKWSHWFKNSSKSLTSIEDLPTKNQLLKVFKKRYETLSKAYIDLSPKEKFSRHPSKIMEGKFTNLDSWFAHHLTTHIAVHCGNIVVWKRIIGLKVKGS